MRVLYAKHFIGIITIITIIIVIIISIIVLGLAYDVRVVCTIVTITRRRRRHGSRTLPIKCRLIADPTTLIILLYFT